MNMRRVDGGLDGDSLVFVISECEVHVLCIVVRRRVVMLSEELTQALCGGTLMEVVNGGASLTS